MMFGFRFSIFINNLNNNVIGVLDKSFGAVKICVNIFT